MMKRNVRWKTEIVANGCLAVSAIQASGQALERVEDPGLKASIVCGIVLALLTSQVLMQSVGALSRAPKGIVKWIAVGCLVAVVGLIEFYSVGTSTTSVDSGFLSGQRKENLESPERAALVDQQRSIQKDLDSAQAHKDDLKRERNRLPDDWFKARDRIERRIDIATDEIEGYRKQISTLQYRIESVGVSVSRESFANFESLTGFGQTSIIFLFALLMSACPAVLRLVQGVSEMSEPNGGGRATVTPIKKNRDHLDIAA
jgi:hypothetical protein